MIRLIQIYFLVLATGATLLAQNPENSAINTVDSLILEEDHVEIFTEISTLNPKRAAILSAILPGLGQIYNKQYWKVPLIWGGAVILGHYIKYRDRLYNSLRSALIAETDADPRTINPFGRFTAQALEFNIDKLQRDRDNLIIMTTLFYLLNIVDAHVSAHLHEFQINDALSLNIRPIFYPSALASQSVGISFSLKL